MIETVLCVDIGTTSLKAGLISATGEVVSFSKYSFLSYDNRFIANHWLNALHYCLIRMLKNKPDVVIKAVSISGNGPTIVSDSGMTLRWNEDYYVDKRRTEASLFLPRLIAFKELFTKEYERTRHLFSGPEFLIYKLTDTAVTVLPDERYLSAYWTDKDLSNVDVNIDVKKMPPMKLIGERLGFLSPEIIKSLKLSDHIPADKNNKKENVPVYSCGPDFTAALVGTGTLSPGKICDRSGSSEGFNLCINRPVAADGLRLLPSVIPGLWNISALLTTSSKLSEKRRLEKVIECVDRLKLFAKNNGFDFPQEMTVTGGQTLNKGWMKKKAAALNMNLSVCNFSNSELLGDACAAWYGLGKYSSLQEAADKIVVKDIVYGNL